MTEPGSSRYVAEAQIVDGVDVDALVAAVTSCPDVAGMATNALDSAVTLLPGRRVAGVHVGDDEVRVEVRARWGATAAEIAREVRDATSVLLGNRPLHVVIADIDLPEVLAPAAEPDITVSAPYEGPDGRDTQPTALPGEQAQPRSAEVPHGPAGPPSRGTGPGDRPDSPS